MVETSIKGQKTLWGKGEIPLNLRAISPFLQCFPKTNTDNINNTDKH